MSDVQPPSEPSFGPEIHSGRPQTPPPPPRPPAPQPVPVYIPPPQAPARKGGFFSRMMSTLFVSIFVGSIILNIYLAMLLQKGIQGQVYRDGDDKNQIALISLNDTINMGTASELWHMFKRAAQDESVRGVILVVNSPGGQVVPSDMANKYIRDYEEATGNPVYAVIEQVGASGAYWISCACDKIYAQTNAIVGSIGVIYLGLVAEDLLQNKLGIDPLIITSTRSPFKFRGPPFHQPSEEGRQEIIEDLDTIHKRFVDVVMRGRGFDPNEAWALADGQVYDGPDSLEKGLVDAVGYLDDAIDDMAKEIKVSNPQVIHYVTPPSLRELLLTYGGADRRPSVSDSLGRLLATPGPAALWPDWVAVNLLTLINPEN